MRQIISPLDGFRSPFGALRGGFSPSALFALAEPGVWYDPSDLTTLFQDTAGTTPVTTPGQTVALALDKSKGLVLGSEIVVNGNFATDTDWVKGTGWTISGGVASYNGTDAPNAIYQSAANLDSGKSYRVSITVSLTQGALLVRPSFNSTAGQYQINSSGTYSILLSGQGGQFGLIAGSSGGRFIGTIDNISVRELPGFHATQATAASRPTYGIVPLGGRRNLLERTEEFDNAYWSKNNATVTANAITAPNGTSSADLLTSTGVDGAVNRFVGTSGTQYTLSVYAKRGNSDWIAFSNNGFFAYFNIQSGAVGTVGDGVASVLSVGDGWFRCSWTPANLAQNTTWRIRCAVSNGNVATTNQTAYFWGAQLETGSTATAYQRVGSAFDVTEAGVASLSYLSFDGVDDFLVTPTITPGTDKVQTFAGVRKLSDAAAGEIVGLSTSPAGLNGTFFLRAPSQAAPNYQFRSRGTTANGSIYTNALVAAPVTNVLGGIGDISAPNEVLRVNGVAVASSTLTQGTGNYGNYPLYIGRVAGTSQPFNGNIFSLIVRFGTNLDAGTITSTETWVNGKTGAYA